MLATVLGAATGAALFAGTAALGGYGDPDQVALSVFASHLVSELVLVSFFMEHSIHSGDSGPIERGLRWATTLTVALVAFLPSDLPALVFLVMPVVGWGALRAPMREALWQLVAVATMANTLSTFGLGPFQRLSTLDHRGAELATLPEQVFVLGCAVCIPFAMAVARQQHGAWQIAKERTRLERIVESATGTATSSPTRPEDHPVQPRCRGAAGYARSEVLGRFPDLFSSPEEIARQARHFGVPADLRHVSLALAEPDVGRVDWIYVHQDGSTRDVSVSLVQIMDKDQVVGYVCTAEDISERVRTQAALEAALATERRAVSRLTESTEQRRVRLQRQPRAAHPDHQHRGLPRAARRRRVRRGPTAAAGGPAIEANSHRLLELIDDLLTLSSVESLDLDLSRRPVDLREVVRRAGERVTREADERRQHLDLVVPDEPVIVLGDEPHLQRMVANLAVNAVKFTPEGGTITLRVVPRGDGGVIEVQDTGVGISAEERPLLFNRFYRTSYAQAEAVKGSGLGLSIARSIAHLHGARISAVSEPGQGSVFSVSFEATPHSAGQGTLLGL